MRLVSAIVLRFGPEVPDIAGQFLELKVFDGDENDPPTGGKLLGDAPAVSWRIGRSRKICDYVINDGLISAIHFSIIFDPSYGERGEPAWFISDGGYYPYDLKRKGDNIVPAGYKSSTWGTWLNGQQLGADKDGGEVKPKLQRLMPQDRIFAYPSVKIIVFSDLHATELPSDIWAGDWREKPPDGKLISPAIQKAIANDTAAAPRDWRSELIHAFEVAGWGERLYYGALLLCGLAIAISLPLLLAGAAR